MGFRVRKSINLGGGFRINLSKSGIGYSWGTKGYRVTGTSRGTTRRTYSIPGTGISWVDESGSGRRNRSRNNNSRRNNTGNRNTRQQPQPAPRQNYRENYNQAPSRTIESADIEQFKQAEEGTISDALERTIRMNWIGTILIFGIILGAMHPAVFIVPVVGIFLKIAAHTVGRVNLEYTFDPEKQDEHNRRIGAWQLLAEGDKEWQVLTEQFNSNRKTNAGAGRNLKRVVCKIQKGHPYYIDTNVDAIQVILANKEQLVILPDKVFFIRKRRVGIIDYSDVNQNGTPDRRYKNNRQIPLCLYGQVFLRSSSGLNVELQISNIQNARDFAELVE